LRKQDFVLQVLPLGQVLSTLSGIVPALCRHIGGGDGALNVRLEAAAAARALMVAVGPGPVVQLALSPLCLGANSSKVRTASETFCRTSYDMRSVLSIKKVLSSSGRAGSFG